MSEVSGPANHVEDVRQVLIRRAALQSACSCLSMSPRSLIGPWYMKTVGFVPTCVSVPQGLHLPLVGHSTGCDVCRSWGSTSACWMMFSRLGATILARPKWMPNDAPQQIYLDANCAPVDSGTLFANHAQHISSPLKGRTTGVISGVVVRKTASHGSMHKELSNERF